MVEKMENVSRLNCTWYLFLKYKCTYADIN